MDENSNILIYQSEDGVTRIETQLQNESVWLSIDQMTELFQKSRSTINEHILNIYKEQELEKEGTMRKIGNSDFSTKPTNYYNLNVIISVGYRVKSLQGTKFRQWATARLQEYLVKGFTMNDELLKQAGGGSYFDELLDRIRDIRSSEKVFWRKVLDIYATSIDYDPKVEESLKFFKTIQNKMHWATHGNTAAEIIYSRIDVSKPFLGLTNFKGEKPTKQETQVAKNYLNEKELDILNKMVTAYLDIADLQATNRKPMYMDDWINKLDDFLNMTGYEILDHAGKISHNQAIEKANKEYKAFKERTKNDLSLAEKDFIKTILSI
ncbi:cell filamentation protein Fic [Methylococcaceae bacterium HT4]|nr:cell filamentation protein Fic [Methylococcaceae bacterium HT4]TXL16244.1 cell filamentation protein Fic [Methylococcaceae bacterium HT5]TXL19852.1 cell filamentation protein Fic [Methylococcaceae bacterium HT2]